MYTTSHNVNIHAVIYTLTTSSTSVFTTIYKYSTVLFLSSLIEATHHACIVAGCHFLSTVARLVAGCHCVSPVKERFVKMLAYFNYFRCIVDFSCNARYLLYCLNHNNTKEILYQLYNHRITMQHCYLIKRHFMLGRRLLDF